MCDVLYLLCFLGDCFQSSLYLLESGLQLASHFALCADLRNLPDKRESRVDAKQLKNPLNANTKYRPGLHRGADRGSEGAYRRCCSGPAGGCLCRGSGPVRTRCLGAAAAPCLGSAGSATDWTGRLASPGPKRGGTLHLHTEGEHDSLKHDILSDSSGSIISHYIC